jgi:hypothetical protein
MDNRNAVRSGLTGLEQKTGKIKVSDRGVLVPDGLFAQLS